MLHIGIRGLMGSTFSKGIGKIVDKLKRKFGGSTVYIGFNEWKEHAEAIVNMHKAGQINGPITITGHSLGAVVAIKFAGYLSANGVPVRCIYLLDYVWTFSNFIAKIFNKGLSLKDSNGKLIADHTVHFFTRDPRVEMIDGTLNKPYYHLNHIQLDEDEKLHEEILEHATRYI